MHFNKASLFVVLILILGFTLYGVVSASTDTIIVSIQCKDKQFKDIIKEIKIKTGYTLVATENLLLKKISGNFLELNLIDFVKRAFKDENIYIITNPKRKFLRIGKFEKESSAISKLGMFQQNIEQPSKHDDTNEFGFLTINELRKNRDMIDRMKKSGKHIVGGYPGVSLRELIEKRDAIENKIKTGEIVIEHSSGVALSNIINERNKIESMLVGKEEIIDP